MSAGTTKATCPMGESRKKRSTSIIVVLNGGKQHAITLFLFHADKYNRQSQCSSHPMPDMASILSQTGVKGTKHLCTGTTLLLSVTIWLGERVFTNIVLLLMPSFIACRGHESARFQSASELAL